VRTVEENAPITVALVDDVDDVRRLVRTALRFRGGFEVVGEARTGAEAIALAADARPDIAVLDLGLPDIAGREVLARVREVSPGTRVVVLSAMEPTDRAWFEERTAGYVLKDADLDYLVDVLENAGRPPTDVRVLDAERDVSAGTQARALVRETLRDWGLVGIDDDAELVVTELVNNAVIHGGSSFRLQLSRTSGAFRIEVVDGGDGTPEPQPQDTEAEGGRGIMLVDAMSSSWGVENVPRGKLVWAEIAIP
jgi:CheY-like chemotaxis protein/anti-sigma regulatory factor (Ser/Thr protein kinase)